MLKAFKVRHRLIVILLIVLVLGAGAYFADSRLPALLAEELPQAEAVLVIKEERKLYLLRDGEPYREYGIALGGNPVGHKKEEGDQRTPEGDYVLDWRNPNSMAHLSLHVSYPNEEDQAQAEARGVSPGGMIMIHGQRNGFGWLGRLLQRWDWTDGCIAVTNVEMEEIWHAVQNGTPIRIEP
ncbi:L,D-transpeptidase family protein [Halomonas sp. ISL-60]|uniref:L,D-transpeptidase family protein n=1 Tax=Halomonas sp. ISL-56 TaxID=2819149 RepID=UPI001BEB995D|nr:L,D-transpeptidase family protein [Halomonas sp. ISL-56]MBT2773701.1 L,D-transpeptidase family protein [Halomonas sp. ISL-60]MBT2803200.1 L,D-transpeptidase family protein [Halomonas sp. ISL-56]